MLEVQKENIYLIFIFLLTQLLCFQCEISKQKEGCYIYIIQCCPFTQVITVVEILVNLKITRCRSASEITEFLLAISYDVLIETSCTSLWLFYLGQSIFECSFICTFIFNHCMWLFLKYYITRQQHISRYVIKKGALIVTN